MNIILSVRFVEMNLQVPLRVLRHNDAKTFVLYHRAALHECTCPTTQFLTQMHFVNANYVSACIKIFIRPILKQKCSQLQHFTRALDPYKSFDTQNKVLKWNLVRYTVGYEKSVRVVSVRTVSVSGSTLS